MVEEVRRNLYESEGVIRMSSCVSIYFRIKTGYGNGSMVRTGLSTILWRSKDKFEDLYMKNWGWVLLW